ncbi:MAG: 50S ribosomal protein L23 [Alphaproteobacteria bacterium ADurb.Bin438]|nr:MAG: 50S ribosomal protein L23 [Alphaproteobacteria bacterium ADurb.Bin438]
MSKKKEEMKIAGKHYEMIRKPIITEKSMKGSEFGHVTFQVPLDANKTEIKEAVEALFKVTVLSVNTVVVKGKVKSFRGVQGKRSDYKKAIVKLAEGNSIDITVGV